MRRRVLLTALGLTAVAAVAHADPCQSPLPAPGASLSGLVRYVGDGDSLRVGSSDDRNTWIEVRLADFFAAELASPGGHQAKAALGDIAGGRTVQCEAGRRSYDRVVARCLLNGVGLGDLVRRRGVPEGGNGR